jgi:hypothetical protein
LKNSVTPINYVLTMMGGGGYGKIGHVVRKPYLYITLQNDGADEDGGYGKVRRVTGTLIVRLFAVFKVTMMRMTGVISNWACDGNPTCTWP